MRSHWDVSSLPKIAVVIEGLQVPQKMSIKAAGRTCFMRQKIPLPELGCGWRTKGWEKNQKRGRNTTNHTMCNPIFSGKSSRDALQLSVGDKR